MRYASWLLHGYIIAVSWLLHGYIIAVSWLLHGYIIAVSWLLHGYIIAVSWLLHGYIIAVSWLLHGYIIADEMILHISLSFPVISMNNSAKDVSTYNFQFMLYSETFEIIHSRGVITLLAIYKIPSWSMFLRVAQYACRPSKSVLP